LRKIDLFKGAIPSKIFEILYMKKPLLLGVAGEALQIFVKDAQAGLPFEPENGADLASRVNLLADNPQLSEELGKNGHKYIMKNFNRNQIAQDFWNFIQFSNDTQTSSDTTNH
jgi:glycosyltransferase involved in cell wall biosynthesis